MMITKSHGIGKASACFMALCVMSAAAVAGDESSAFSLRGFGTLGLARSTSSQAEVARDLLQPRGVSDNWSGRIDSNVGVQVNYVASNTLEAVVQAVSRYNPEGSFAPELTEAVVADAVGGISPVAHAQAVQPVPGGR